jgi:hypothetical protein
MSSAASPTDVSTADARCPHCGAMRKVGSTRCWLCGADLPPIEPGAASAAPASGSSPAGRISFSISTLLLATTLVAVTAALITEVPGLGIPVCILLAPVLVRTVMVVRRREAAGKRVSMGEKVALIVTSFMVINVILAVVGVAAIGSFCAVCIGTAGALNDNSALVVAGVSALTVAAGLLALMFNWVRARYRRDIS